ncbi:MAG: hypothetical protein MPJ50_05370 [Pirellulales bacterium]|nr:hypothetical protein [Pirellulales bacterium]
MARPTLHDGYLLPLKGQQWQIPVIRRPDGTTSLPRDMKLDFANPKQATETIAAEYEEIWADTAEAIDWLEGFNHDPPTVPPMGPAIHLCVRALGLNYRYGIAEQNLLSLANSQTYPAILSALADFPKFAADAQKKARTMARPTNP